MQRRPPGSSIPSVRALGSFATSVAVVAGLRPRHFAVRIAPGIKVLAAVTAVAAFMGVVEATGSWPSACECTRRAQWRVVVLTISLPRLSSEAVAATIACAQHQESRVDGPLMPLIDEFSLPWSGVSRTLGACMGDLSEKHDSQPAAGRDRSHPTGVKPPLCHVPGGCEPWLEGGMRSTSMNCEATAACRRTDARRLRSRVQPRLDGCRIARSTVPATAPRMPSRLSGDRASCVRS